MEAMTLEQERKAFEDWLTDCDTNPQAPPRDNRGNYLESDVRDMWRVWQARAHLAQPAQAVDVGAAWRDLFWQVALELGCLPSTFVDGNSHVLCAARALSVEKAGPAGDGSRSVPCPECRGAGVYPKAAVLPEPPDVTCRKCHGSGRDYLPASPTPDKEGEG